MTDSTTLDQPLILTKEEALGLFDLCLLSRADFDVHQERAVLKLTEIVRGYLQDDAEDGGNSAAQMIVCDAIRL